MSNLDPTFLTKHAGNDPKEQRDDTPEWPTEWEQWAELQDIADAMNGDDDGNE